MNERTDEIYVRWLRGDAHGGHVCRMTDAAPGPTATPPSEAPPTEAAPNARRRRRGPILFVLVAFTLVAAGALAGMLVGRSIADGNTERDDRAAERASKQEDQARDRRDFLETRVRYVDEQTKGLAKVAGSTPMLGSEKTTARVKLGSKFSVDGGTYTVRSFQILDDFDSIDPRRLATRRDGFRWALVEVDYTNKTREDQAPACGTTGTIHLMLADRSTLREVDARDEKPPVAKGTYDRCGVYVEPGQTVRWLAPVRVPEKTKLAGILVADIYARTSHSPYNVRSGKMAWLAFDKPIDTGSSGDDEIDETFVQEDS